MRNHWRVASTETTWPYLCFERVSLLCGERLKSKRMKRGRSVRLLPSTRKEMRVDLWGWGNGRGKKWSILDILWRKSWLDFLVHQTKVWKKLRRQEWLQGFGPRGLEKLVNGVALYLNEEDFTGSRCEVRRAQQLKGLKSGDHLQMTEKKTPSGDVKKSCNMQVWKSEAASEFQI